MLTFLRIVGITNAAIWLGSVFFMVLVGEPSFSSPEMLQFLPVSHAGAAAHVLLKKFYLLQYVCGGVALLHLVFERLYTGKPMNKGVFSLVFVLALLVLSHGTLLQPKNRKLHLDIHGTNSTQAQRQQAQRALGFWHGTAKVVNVIIIAGLLIYVWQTTTAEVLPRFGTGKFRG